MTLPLIVNLLTQTCSIPAKLSGCALYSSSIICLLLEQNIQRVSWHPHSSPLAMTLDSARPPQRTTRDTTASAIPPSMGLSDVHRASRKQLCSAAGSQSLKTLLKALDGWSTEELEGMTHTESKNVVHMAAWRGSLDNLRYLVETLGCSVNTISTGYYSYGKTPIFFATTRCRDHIVRYLLEQGATVKIVNNKGQSVRSLAASHLLPETLRLVCQAEESQDAIPWENYRLTHSDGLEYGDLDPRFLDRPLLETDVVTDYAMNPTTSESRKKSFLRRNPQMAKQLPPQPPFPGYNRKKRAAIILTKGEEESLQKAWNRVLDGLAETASSSSSTTVVYTSQDLFDIISLSDKQRMEWISDAAQRFREACHEDAAKIRLQELFQSLQVEGRLAHLVEKFERRIFLASTTRKNDEEYPPVPDCLKRKIRFSTSTTPTASTTTTTMKRATKTLQHGMILRVDQRNQVREKVQSLSISHFDLGQNSLGLPETPYWVDSMTELDALRNAIQNQSIVAVDTEWYRDDDGRTRVSTLQIALPHDTTRPWVLDLIVKNNSCPDYVTAARSLVRSIFCQPMIVLGFALGHDLPKLEAWLESPIDYSVCLDVQCLFAGTGRIDSSSSTPHRVHQPMTMTKEHPGLARCVSRYAAIPLSKQEQCSNWRQRPLRKSQLEYAALDAAILLALVAERLRELDDAS